MLLWVVLLLAMPSMMGLERGFTRGSTVALPDPVEGPPQPREVGGDAR